MGAAEGQNLPVGTPKERTLPGRGTWKFHSVSCALPLCLSLCEHRQVQTPSAAPGWIGYDPQQRRASHTK